jgi:hypothetical protein
MKPARITSNPQRSRACKGARAKNTRKAMTAINAAKYCIAFESSASPKDLSSFSTIAISNRKIDSASHSLRKHEKPFVPLVSSFGLEALGEKSTYFLGF